MLELTEYRLSTFYNNQFKPTINWLVTSWIVRLVILFYILIPLILYQLESSKFEIYITNNGFSKDYIKVHRGQTVTWVNKDNNMHWPASDFHPSHNLYPTRDRGCIGSSLDACVGLKFNQRFGYRFDSIGVWGIHDHLSPGFTMTIEVLP